MDLIGGITAATEGLKLINELRKIDKELDKSDLKIRLIEVVDKLVDAKQALLGAIEREHELKAEIQRLEAAVKQRGHLEDMDGLLSEKNDDGTIIGQPYCNQCFVKEEKLFRLSYGPYSGGSHKCSNCEGVYGKRDVKEAEASHARLMADIRGHGKNLA